MKTTKTTAKRIAVKDLSARKNVKGGKLGSGSTLVQSKRLN
jgi:hypothetical protein